MMIFFEEIFSTRFRLGTIIIVLRAREIAEGRKTKRWNRAVAGHYLCHPSIL